jgi:hypothetical protein
MENHRVCGVERYAIFSSGDSFFDSRCWSRQGGVFLKKELNACREYGARVYSKTIIYAQFSNLS